MGNQYFTDEELAIAEAIAIRRFALRGVQIQPVLSKHLPPLPPLTETSGPRNPLEDQRRLRQWSDSLRAN